MCGVIGYVGAWGAGEREQAKGIAVQSKIRGLHAFRWAWLVEGQPTVVRVLTLSEFLDSLSAVPEGHVRLIGHCRYSTSGDWRVPGNNQPLLVSGVALAFNGVINMGTKAEMELLLGAPMETDNDVRARTVTTERIVERCFQRIVVVIDGTQARHVEQFTDFSHD